MADRVSKLMRDLDSVPKIIGGLGASVAEAQKKLNVGYLDSLEQLLAMLHSFYLNPTEEGSSPPVTVSAAEEVKDAIKELLIQFAPSRYQFTETTLQVRMDLAQSTDIGIAAGGSFGVRAMAVNAALSAAFGQSYQQAAEVKTVLHAIPGSVDIMNALLDRTSLPGLTTIEHDTDLELVKGTQKIVEAMIGGEKLEPPAAEGESTD